MEAEKSTKLEQLQKQFDSEIQERTEEMEKIHAYKMEQLRQEKSEHFDQVQRAM